MDGAMVVVVLLVIIHSDKCPLAMEEGPGVVVVVLLLIGLLHLIW